jgi:predicted MFS family arabinose efflux permease
MFWSLFTTGFLFIMLQFITTFEGFLIGIFLTMTVADMFRPAMFVSLKAYSKPENRTRSLTLIRLAINLGFSFGPFLGGIIIAGIGYAGLFWVDGITCILAIFIMKLVLKKKAIKKPLSNNLVLEASSKSVYQDKPFWIFLMVVFIMGFMFLQLFTTLPLFYREVHNLTEVQIGLIMALNGFLIFLFEMPLIHYIEKTLLDRMRIITWSLALFALSFVVLNTFNWVSILILGMIFITVGEMLAFPFTNNFAMSRAPEGKEGRYLALYSMSFSFAHIFSAKTGMEVINQFGFSANWYLMGVLGVVAIVLMLLLRKELALEKS